MGEVILVMFNKALGNNSQMKKRESKTIGKHGPKEDKNLENYEQ